MTTENARIQTPPAYAYSQSNYPSGFRESQLRSNTPYSINLLKTLFQPTKANE
jgi:hypothetical protein